MVMWQIPLYAQWRYRHTTWTALDLNAQPRGSYRQIDLFMIPPLNTSTTTFDRSPAAVQGANTASGMYQHYIESIVGLLPLMNTEWQDMDKSIGGHSKISRYVLRLQDPSDIANHRLTVQEVTNASHAGVTVMGGWSHSAYKKDPSIATIRGSILVHADTDLRMLATSNMSDQNLWGHGRHAHLWHPHQHAESGTGSPALASLISDDMLGHVSFNLCEVHGLSRVALYIRHQALFTLIQRNPAHQVPYDADTIRQMVQMIQAHLPHRAVRLVRDKPYALDRVRGFWEVSFFVVFFEESAFDFMKYTPLFKL